MISFIPVHSRFGHSMQHVPTGRILDAVHKVVMCNSTSATKAGISANVHSRAEGCFGLLAVLGELAVSLLIRLLFPVSFANYLSFAQQALCVCRLSGCATCYATTA